MIKLLKTAVFGLSTLYTACVAGDMFLDLHRDSNVSSLNDRHYSASLGRFLTPDKAKISISEYTYMSSNVIKNSDPSGLGLWSTFKEIIKGNRIRSSDFPISYDRDTPRDGATKLKREDRGTHRAPVKGNQETIVITTAVIPDPEIGTNTPTLINSNYQDVDTYDTNDIMVRRLREHQNPESNPFPPEYNPSWNKDMGNNRETDIEVRTVKGHTANISGLSSDDDLGSPVSTTSNRANGLNRTKAMIFNPTEDDMDMPIENTQAAQFNEDTGLAGSLDKNKKIIVGAGVVVLGVSGAALATYTLLKNKNEGFAPQPSMPCSGMTPHPAPC